MKILYRKQFLKQFRKLRADQQRAVLATIDHFSKDPFASELRNHPLKGTMKGQRAILVGFDLRIIFREHGKYTIVVMIAVGTHGEVY